MRPFPPVAPLPLFLLCVLALAGVGAGAGPARAGAELDRVRAEGVVRCASATRAGIAFPNLAEQKLYGLGLEVCRAVAAAVLGAPEKIRYRLLRTPAEFASLRDSGEELFFLTAADIIANHLADVVVPGPAVLLRGQQVIVRADSPMHSLEDLRGQHVCAEPGTEAQRALTAWSAAHDIRFTFFPFEEQEEMLDAFQAGRCTAMANDSLQLAGLRVDAGHKGTALRLLSGTLSMAPILAATRIDDGGWSAAVAWVVDTLQHAAEPGVAVRNGAVDTLNIAAPALGLSPGWQARMLGATGDYAAIYARTVGADSPLDLPPGPNAPQEQGGLLVPPHAE